MREQGYEVITASASGPEVEEVMKREGIKHFPISFTRTLSPMQDLKALWELIRLIKKEKPDIIHTHTPKAGLLGMMAAKYCGVKLRVHTVAGMPLMEATGATKHILNLTEKVTYSCSKMVYPNSFQMKLYMEEHFPGYKLKYKVIGQGSSNGINTSYFSKAQIKEEELDQLKQQLSIKEEDVVFCFVGRLVHDKGIHELVEAVKNLSGNFKLLLVGNYEDEREPVSDEIKEEINANPNIKAVGFQKDIRPYLALADVFVFPSYREGFPNVVLQAAAMELPCIVSDINGCNEIIAEGFNGLIVPAKQVAPLQKAIKLLQNDSNLREKLKSNARASIMAKYEQKIIWEALLKEYRELGGR